MFRPKRDLMILLMLVGFTLLGFTLAYVMPYKAPAMARSPATLTTRVANDGALSYGALMNYYRPVQFSGRPFALSRSTANASRENYRRPADLVSHTGASDPVQRDWTALLVANGPTTPSVRPGSGLVLPPGFFLLPDTWPGTPGGGDEGIVGIYFPGGDIPGGDIPGGDIPGGDIPGGDIPGGDIPGGDIPGGDIPGGQEAHPPIPIPGSVWLFGTGLGIFAWWRKRGGSN